MSKRKQIRKLEDGVLELTFKIANRHVRTTNYDGPGAWLISDADMAELRRLLGELKPLVDG